MISRSHLQRGQSRHDLVLQDAVELFDTTRSPSRCPVARDAFNVDMQR